MSRIPPGGSSWISGSALLALIGIALASTFSSCGRSTPPLGDTPPPSVEDAEGTDPGEGGVADGGASGEGPDHEPTAEPSPDPADAFRARKVTGNAFFTSHCAAFGTYSQPVPAPLWLWDCPVTAETLELEQNLRNVRLVGDCKDYLITARTDGGTGEARDSTWEVMPGGRFYFSFAGEDLRFKSDGMGSGSCTAKSKLTEFYGNMDCSNPDKPIIRMAVEWNLENGTCAFPAPSAEGKKCHLYSYTEIRQCE